MTFEQRLKRVRANRDPLLSRSGCAAFGLALVLAIVPTLIFWGALQNYRAGIASQLANEASDAFQQARYSVGEEESLERQYRLEPTQEIRARHTQAAAEMVSWLEKARARERGVDVAAIEAIVAKHATYLGNRST
jgi:hypothetical protein